MDYNPNAHLNHRIVTLLGWEDNDSDYLPYKDFEGNKHDELPDYKNELDLVLRLPLEKGCVWRLIQNEWGWKVYMQNINHSFTWLCEQDCKSSDELAEAVGEAWCYYMLKKKEKEEKNNVS